MIFKFDKKKPNGTMRKLIDISYANKLGCNAQISLTQGFEMIRDDILNNLNDKN